MKTENKSRKKRKKRLIIFGSILLVYLAIVQVALPIYLRNKINDEINALEGYSGEVEDVDVWLLLGAYEIEGITIYNDDFGKDAPLFSAERITISLHWAALFSGQIVSEVDLYDPEVNFAISAVDESQVTKRRFAFGFFILKNKIKNLANDIEEGNLNLKIKKTYDDLKLTVFSDLLLNQVPTKINHIVVHNGSFYYRDFTSKPYAEAALTDLDLEFNNLTNSKKLSESLIADFSLVATLQNSGDIYAYGKLDPYDEDITCDLNVEISSLPLTNFNDMLNAYAKFDIDEGMFGMYSEVSIRSGDLDGYMKPFIKDLKIANLKSDHNKPVKLLWESVVGIASLVIKNIPKNEIATNIQLKGNINDPKFVLWKTVGGLFLHSILRNVKPELDNTIELQSKTSEASQD